MIDYARAYTATWRLFRVNPSTWADGAQSGRLLSASVMRTGDGDAPEIDSGTLTVEGDPTEGFEPGYYRLAMTAMQSGEADRVDVATLLCETDGGKVQRKADRKSVIGRSVLHPAATAEVPDGTCVPKGADGAQAAAELLRGAVQAPVDVDGSFALADHYCFDFGASVLSCAWKLLRAGSFCIQTDGRGMVHIRPMPTELALSLDRAAASILDPSVAYQLDLSAIPNRFTARADGYAATVRNEGGSAAGFAARGYWVDASDDSPVLLEGETLQSYAERRLAELSVAYDERAYTRAWAELAPYDIVEGAMADARLEGRMRIKSQRYQCGNMLKVSETAAREVKLWP